MLLPFGLPDFVRLNRRLGHDYIANLTFDGWWLFEEPLPVAMAALAQATDGAMYDVGANTGFYSALVGRLSPTTVVRAFEPIPAIADFARENLAIAGLDVDRVTLEQVALSDRPGTAELFLPPEIPGRIESSASLLSDFKPTVVESVTAATETLDGANERFSGERVGLIKIDVEGAEHLVVAGAGGVLARDRPIVVMELLDRADFDHAQRTFDELDYRFLSLHPGFELREQQTLRFFLDAWNHLLLPAEEYDRLRAVLSEAASQYAQFLEAAGDPMDSAVLDRAAEKLPVSLLVDHVRVEARAASVELRSAQAALEPKPRSLLRRAAGRAKRALSNLR